MLTVEEIKGIIEQAEKQKQELQELIDSLSTMEVEPDDRQKKGEIYYYIGDIGQIMSATECNSLSDNYRYEIGNYYLTPEDAEKAERRIKLFRLLDRFSRQHGWTDDIWRDDSISKHFIFFDRIYNRIKIGFGWCVTNATGVYFISESIAKQAIEKYHDLIVEVMGI